MGSSGASSPQWLINLGQALVELRKRGPSLCKMCHKNPAEYSGYCGDCYQKVENRSTDKESAESSTRSS